MRFQFPDLIIDELNLEVNQFWAIHRFCFLLNQYDVMATHPNLLIDDHLLMVTVIPKAKVWFLLIPLIILNVLD